MAYNVFGGRFAINGGALPGEMSEVCYFAPDELARLPLCAGHTAFVTQALSENKLEDFYQKLRWDGWREGATRLNLDQPVGPIM